MKRYTVLLPIFMLLFFSTPVHAVLPEDAGTATAQINGFDETLLSTMKEAKTLGYKGRFERMAPAVDKTFDLPFMARFLVGMKWNDLDSGQQAALVKSFRNFTIGQYANRFNDYDGEMLQIVGTPTDQRSDIRVQTELKPKNEPAVKLDYILHHGDKGLRVIDIFLQGTISQLATQRSQFQSVLAKSGVDGLVAMLDSKGGDAAIAGVSGPSPGGSPADVKP